MYQITSVYCTVCHTFIGNLGDIKECPICGNVLVEQEVDQKQEEDE